MIQTFPDEDRRSLSPRCSRSWSAQRQRSPRRTRIHRLRIGSASSPLRNASNAHRRIQALQDDRKWAVQRLTDTLDVTVNLCLGPARGVSKKDYAHSPRSSSNICSPWPPFIIENPGKADDMDAQQLAGAEGALNAYRSMRTAQPNDTSPVLEKLLGLQSRGELPGFVRKATSPLLGEGLRNPKPALLRPGLAPARADQA